MKALYLKTTNLATLIHNIGHHGSKFIIDDLDVIFLNSGNQLRHFHNHRGSEKCYEPIQTNLFAELMFYFGSPKLGAKSHASYMVNHFAYFKPLVNACLQKRKMSRKELFQLLIDCAQEHPRMTVEFALTINPMILQLLNNNFKEISLLSRESYTTKPRDFLYALKTQLTGSALTTAISNESTIVEPTAESHLVHHPLVHTRILGSINSDFREINKCLARASDIAKSEAFLSASQLAGNALTTTAAPAESIVVAPASGFVTPNDITRDEGDLIHRAV